ncbi:DUF1833 family protein [Grimontia hollisae]|uniref:DUF1833 family protein n=1 Tax=Grimontia hollisae TaxID=673 RepID=UPI0012ACD044|nr:DUF1833 family protein [Grimontia hollisae]
MKAIEIAYASNSEDVPIYCLEFAAPSIPNGAYRLVLGYNDVTVTSEKGEQLHHQAAAFALSLPARSVKGRQDINFNVDNVTGEVAIMVDNCLEANEKVWLTLRKYSHLDLSAPAEPPIRMSAVATEMEDNQVRISASFNDLVNTPFPRSEDRYTQDIAPGLLWMG